MLPANLNDETYRLRIAVDSEKSPRDPLDAYQPAELNTWLAANEPTPTLAAVDHVVTTAGDRLERRVYVEDEDRADQLDTLAKREFGRDGFNGQRAAVRWGLANDDAPLSLGAELQGLAGSAPQLRRIPKPTMPLDCNLKRAGTATLLGP